MNPLFRKNHRLVFYLSWLALGLIQSYLTELQDDEAYYWVYAQYPDWGYFDHPPMIAMLVKFGTEIFPGELGVRFFPLLLNVLSIYLIEKLTYYKNPALFYAIALSIAVVQLTGFIAVPDIPLIFFTALFFWLYNRFLQKGSLLNCIFLGLSIAFLFYSKYHAILIVLFTLLSNLKLLRRPQAWIAVFVAFTLFLPHLWWQYQHHWVSFKYHLFENHVNPYKIKYTLDYFLGQILLAGPLAGIILIPSALASKPADQFTQALKYTLVGFYIFFFLSSFRGNVEPNWTAPVLIPLIILSHKFLAENPNWQRWLFRILPATLVFILFARIAMIFDILPFEVVKQRYHAWDEWPEIMKEKTRNNNIVFSNSYQRASKYWFYTGQLTYSQNHYRERRNNFNFWPVEDSVLGKPVYFLDVYDLDRYSDSIKTPLGVLGFKYDSAFTSFAKLNLRPEKFEYTIKRGDSMTVNISAEIPPLYLDYINSHPGIRSSIIIGVYDKYGWVSDIPTSLNVYDLVKGPLKISIQPVLKPGKYFLRFAILAGNYNPTHNSRRLVLTVKEDSPD